MRIVFKIFIMTLIVSYQIKPDTIDNNLNHFPIVIDSSDFLMNLDYDKIQFTQIVDQERNKFLIEKLNEKHGDIYLFMFYLVDKIKISDNLFLFISYSPRNNKIPLEVFIEKYNLTTMNSNFDILETIEIGLYEAHFGKEILKTCKIGQDLEIEINTLEKTENLNTGEIQENKKLEKWFIDKNGKILMRQ